MIILDLSNIDKVTAYYYAYLTSAYKNFYCYDTNTNQYMNLTVQQLDKKLLKGEMINGFYLDSDKETVKQKPFWYKDVLFYTKRGIYYETDSYVLWFFEGDVFYRTRCYDGICLGFDGLRLQMPLRRYEIEVMTSIRKRLCSMSKEQFLQDYKMIALKLQMMKEDFC